MDIYTVFKRGIGQCRRVICYVDSSREIATRVTLLSTTNGASVPAEEGDRNRPSTEDDGSSTTRLRGILLPYKLSAVLLPTQDSPPRDGTEMMQALGGFAENGRPVIPATHQEGQRVRAPVKTNP